MNKPFDVEIFLAGVLTGAHATRERHIRQAKTIQAAISERWNRDNSGMVSLELLGAEKRSLPASSTLP